MPICSVCKLDLEVENFAKHRDGLQSKCRKCHAKYRKQHYENNRQKYIDKAIRYKNKTITNFKELKSSMGGCIKCGEQEIACLDFHHLRDKEETVSQMITHKKWQDVLDEIDKCILLCANCHRKLHAGLIKLEDENVETAYTI